MFELDCGHGLQIRAIWFAYTDDGSGTPYVVEESNYYPFGLKHKGYNEPEQNMMDWGNILTTYSSLNHKYKFQGQERQDELGLNWDSFKWRNYDYAIGRFMNVDPLSEKYVHNGVYNFSENRVVDSRELEGLEAVNADSVRKAMDDNKKGKTYSMTIKVDQPGKGGTRNTYEGNPISGVDVGHTFITLTKSNTDGSQTSTTFGFYPKDGVNPGIGNQSTGIILDDTGHNSEVAASYKISENGLENILDYVESKATTTYDLNTNNCTDFAINAAKEAGVTVPDTQGTWPLGGGSNPGDLGQDLRNLLTKNKNKSNNKTPTTRTSSGSSKKEKDEKKIDF